MALLSTCLEGFGIVPESPYCYLKSLRPFLFFVLPSLQFTECRPSTGHMEVWVEPGTSSFPACPGRVSEAGVVRLTERDAFVEKLL